MAEDNPKHSRLKPNLHQKNPYLDPKIEEKFVSEDDNKKYIQQHQQIQMKSKIANIYDLYKEQIGTIPNDKDQLFEFAQKYNIKVTYSECVQFMNNKRNNENNQVNLSIHFT